MTSANDNQPSSVAPLPNTARPCAVCGKPQDPVYRPFCSKRCADVDLHRWLGGVYAVPVGPEDAESDGPSDTE